MESNIQSLREGIMPLTIIHGYCLRSPNPFNIGDRIIVCRAREDDRVANRRLGAIATVIASDYETTHVKVKYDVDNEVARRMWARFKLLEPIKLPDSLKKGRSYKL